MYLELFTALLAYMLYGLSLSKSHIWVKYLDPKYPVKSPNFFLHPNSDTHKTFLYSLETYW